MNNIKLDIINFFTFKNIIIFLLVVVVIYLLIKINKNNREDFYTNTIGNEAINNLGKISKSIYNDNTLRIPCNLKVGFTNIIPIGLITIWRNYDDNYNPIQPPKGWALCDGSWAWVNPEGDVKTSIDFSIDDVLNEGYTLTPNLSSVLNGGTDYIIKLTELY